MSEEYKKGYRDGYRDGQKDSEPKPIEWPTYQKVPYVYPYPTEPNEPSKRLCSVCGIDLNKASLYCCMCPNCPSGVVYL